MKASIFSLCLLASVGAGFTQDLSAFRDSEGITGEVLALVVQKDGKVVLGGNFTAVNGVPRQNLARLNADGTLDTTFISEAVLGPNGPVTALLLLSDGSIVAGGDFSTVDNLTRGDLVKISPDGKADPKFGSMEGGVATNGSIAALALQPDGSIIVGGSFTTFYGQPRRGIARLLPDGSVAKSDAPSNTLEGNIRALGTAPAGLVFAAGRFTLPSQSAHGILRMDH